MKHYKNKVNLKPVDEVQENIEMLEVSEVYFLARLRDRIVMQDCSVIIENDSTKNNNNKDK